MSTAPPQPGPRRFGLRTEVGALVAAISVTASVGAGALAYRQMTELTHRAGLNHATAVLEALAVPAAVAIADNDLPKLDSFVAELVARRPAEVLHLEVVDEAGHVLATSQTGMVGVQAQRFEPGFMSAALASEGRYWSFEPDLYAPTRLDLAQPVMLGQRWGTLVAQFSLDHLTDRLETLKLTVIMLSALSALLGWVVSVFLLDRLVVRPVRRLAAMAQRLGEGELDIRTAYRRSDEVGDLGAALNTMARRLERYTAGLEGAVRERTADLEAANRELERLATTDALTQVANRRHLLARANAEMARARRNGAPLSVILLDLDEFKRVNDTLGHEAGDRVLVATTAVIEEQLRPSDLLGRMGGEEFCVLLPETRGEGALEVAERLREALESAQISTDRGAVQVTASFGVACQRAPDEPFAPLLARADRAMYRAKARGRNRVEAAVALPDEPVDAPN